MKNIILARLREPSTYAGIATLLMGAAAFVPHAQEVAQSVTILGAAIAGLLAVWMPERK